MLLRGIFCCDPAFTMLLLAASGGSAISNAPFNPALRPITAEDASLYRILQMSAKFRMGRREFADGMADAPCDRRTRALALITHAPASTAEPERRRQRLDQVIHLRTQLFGAASLAVALQAA